MMADSGAPSDFQAGVAAERARVVAWLKRYAVANRKAADTPCHSSSPARTIDLRARANSCAMHATYIEYGKHLVEDFPEPEAFSDAVVRLEAENAELRAALPTATSKER